MQAPLAEHINTFGIPMLFIEPSYLLVINCPLSTVNCQLYGDVKVSTGVLNLGKRVAVWNRYKIHNLNLNGKTNKLALAA